MNDFFQGWRRKTGFATLVLAVLISAAWGLSSQVSVTIDQDLGDWQYHAHSRDGEFGVWWYRPNEWVRRRSVQWFWGKDRAALNFWIEANRDVCSRKFEGCSFSNQESENQIGATDFAELTVPYWQPILPMTLLSAFLILWKPRRWESVADSER
jgi:hypothetical protein